MPAAKFVRQKDLLRIFGNPSRIGWADKNITRIVPPYPMRFGKAVVESIQINKMVARDLEDILAEIWIAAGRDIDAIRAFGADRFDGSFVVRSVRGGKGWSAHAFGMAIDLNARCNPLGKKPGATKGSFTANSTVVKIFEAHGWTWGGRFKNRKDGMHFSATGG